LQHSFWAAGAVRLHQCNAGGIAFSRFPLRFARELYKRAIMLNGECLFTLVALPKAGGALVEKKKERA
jgi:hypothetical protein